jgi:hypothetical protein
MAVTNIGHKLPSIGGCRYAVEATPISRKQDRTKQAQAAHDQVVAEPGLSLNETPALFPGTNGKLIYEIGSSGIPLDQGV